MRVKELIRALEGVDCNLDVCIHHRSDGDKCVTNIKIKEHDCSPNIEYVVIE